MHGMSIKLIFSVSSAVFLIEPVQVFSFVQSIRSMLWVGFTNVIVVI